MNVVVNNLMTNYHISGKGKLVVLLHGWGDTAEGLKNLNESLSSNYKVLTLDLPGFGGTQTPSDVWDLDNYSDFLNKTLSKLDLEQPYAVIGHSNGGALAIRAVSLGKISPKKLILVAASGIRSGNNLKRFSLTVIAKTGNIATIWMPERYRQGLRKSLYQTAGSDMLVAPNLEDTFKKTVRQDVQADALKINLPTLLIYGKNDTATPVRYGYAYNKLIEGSKLEIIDDAGHFVHHDQSKKVLELIKDFLK